MLSYLELILIAKALTIRIEIEAGAVLLFSRIYIRGNNNVVHIGTGVHARNAEFWIEDDGNSIVVENNTTFIGKIHLACIEGTSISIGKNCLFSSEIVFRTGDSHSILNAEGKRINPSEAIKIGDHVWVGHRVTVLKGVSVPNNTVIGTGSIITKSFSEGHVIIAGVPGKIIRRQTNWNVERIDV